MHYNYNILQAIFIALSFQFKSEPEILAHFLLFFKFFKGNFLHTEKI